MKEQVLNNIKLLIQKPEELFSTPVRVWMTIIVSYGVCSRFPLGGTHFTVLVGVLEGLNQTQRFVYWTTNRQIVHRYLPQYAVAINDEETAAEAHDHNDIQHTIYM